MGVGLSMGVNGFLASVEWSGEDVDEEGGRIVVDTKGGEWAVWDLNRIEGGGRIIPMERGQIVHTNNVVVIRYSLPKKWIDGRRHAIASKANSSITYCRFERNLKEPTDEIDQTNRHTIHSLHNHYDLIDIRVMASH